MYIFLIYHGIIQASHLLSTTTYSSYSH